jgi:urease accessory protein
MSRAAFRLIVTVAILLAPGIAFAHPGYSAGGGLLVGFLHPFSGIDHLLAMTAVGLLAAHLGGRALWAVPLTFVAVMTLGGVCRFAGVSLPFVETAIALSVLVFGAAIFMRMTLPVFSAMALVGMFALFHGHAHGTEMPANSVWLAYGVGFMIATVVLHGFGIALGLAMRWIDEAPRRRVIQTCGAAIALVGAGLTFGLV